MSRSSSGKQYIGRDKPKVEYVTEPEPHWSVMEKYRKDGPGFPPKEYGDNDPSSPEEAGWDKLIDEG